jgi:hypothetical protein
VVFEAGLTEMLLPVPMGVPEHEPLNHFQLAPLPNVPPLTLNVVLLPLQIVVVPVMLLAGTEVSLTVTNWLLHTEFLQVPSART